MGQWIGSSIAVWPVLVAACDGMDSLMADTTAPVGGGLLTMNHTIVAAGHTDRSAVEAVWSAVETEAPVDGQALVRMGELRTEKADTVTVGLASA